MGAYPTPTETALETKKPLQEIIARFGLPLALGSDNGPAFTAKAGQNLMKVLNKLEITLCV